MSGFLVGWMAERAPRDVGARVGERANQPANQPTNGLLGSLIAFAKTQTSSARFDERLGAKMQQVGAQNPLSWGPKANNLGPNWRPKSLQNRSQEASWKGLGGSQEALGGVLGGSWLQDSPNSQTCSKMSISFSPLGDQVGAQNPPKIDFEAFQKVVIFLRVFWIDFWSHLEPTWPHLGTQDLPQMEPSWLQNRSTVCCRFESCF